MSEMLSRFDLMRATLIRLAFHDVAADIREDVPHCLELQAAIAELGGTPTDRGSWAEMFTEEAA